MQERQKSVRSSSGGGAQSSRNFNSKSVVEELTDRIQVHRDSLGLDRKGSAGTDASRKSVSLGAHSRRGSTTLPVKSNFHHIQLRILELRGLAARYSAPDELLTRVRVLLSMAGFTHASRPIRIANQCSADIPDESFDFETDSSINDLLLSVRVVDDAHYIAPSKRATDHLHHTPELTAGAVDLQGPVEAGGEHRLQFKMSCDSESGSIPELAVLVRSQCRKTDFVFVYHEDGPVFRKAGYEITPRGISAFPQFYSKRGLPPGFSLQGLKASHPAPPLFSPSPSWHLHANPSCASE